IVLRTGYFHEADCESTGVATARAKRRAIEKWRFMKSGSFNKAVERARCTRSKINRPLICAGSFVRNCMVPACVVHSERAYDCGMRVLLVEDDSRIAHFVDKGLREQAYAVDVAVTGEEALYQVAVNTYDVIVLDVMIPEPDGFAVCKELRRTGHRMPVLMLTARDAVEDRIEGLDRGAD